MNLEIKTKKDVGVPAWADLCPLCGGSMNMYETGNMFNESTYFLRCKSNTCIFGDTKTISWTESLKKSFNNRYVDFGSCIAKECYSPVVVRASHLCEDHEREYL